MRLCIIAILLFSGLSCFAQINFFKKNSNTYRNLENSQFYPVQAQSAKNYNHFDTVINSLKNVFQLCTLLPEKYSFETYKLYSINADSIINKTISLMCGYWKSEGMGSNWDYSGKLFYPNKNFIFTKDEVFFYSKDSLVRHTRYKIILDKYKPLEFQNPLFELEDTKEQWSLHIIKIGESVPWHGKAQKLHLLFNKQPNCVCGCPEELYSSNEKDFL